MKEGQEFVACEEKVLSKKGEVRCVKGRRESMHFVCCMWGLSLKGGGDFGKESLRECFGRKIGYIGGGVRARLWRGHVGEEWKLEVCGECSG
ncbi:hypothetical protein AAJP84_06135 [Bartonella schoenbuchensis]|uniref:hypothetical protein n=1 Tax=Bartonella schoenbuchensis TaxID=165694 RepID=UPI0031CC726F